MNKLKDFWEKSFRAFIEFFRTRFGPKPQVLEIVPIELENAEAFFGRRYHKMVGFKDGRPSMDGPFDEVKLIEGIDIRTPIIRDTIYNK